MSVEGGGGGEGRREGGVGGGGGGKGGQREKGGKRRGGVGGLSSWVLSGSHHVPPRRPTSSCGPGAQGRKLDTGPSTAGMLWERSACAYVCEEKLRLTGGRLLSRVVGLSLNPPPPTPST